MADEDQDSTLGQEWGALAGHKPEDALRQVIGLAGDRETENQRLREQVAQNQQAPPADPGWYQRPRLEAMSF